MFAYDEILNVHLEISSRCNAACPECPRNMRGADAEDLGDFVVHDMTLDEVKSIFTVDFLKQLQLININGNFGDFVTCRDALKIVQYFVESNKNIRIDISTNASGQPKIWPVLGAIENVQVHFRIDGLADTHSLYRQYTDFDLIMDNAQKFITAGGDAVWTMIKFDHNQHQIAECEALSKQLGFSRFELIDAGRNNTVVFDRDGNYLRSIGNPVGLSKDINVIRKQKITGKQNPDFTDLYIPIQSQEIKCQVQKPAQIYVQANGQVYPCCWIGLAPDTNTARPGTDQTRAIAQNNNALEVGLEQAIGWFDQLEKTWTIDTVAQGRHYTCNEICGVKQ